MDVGVFLELCARSRGNAVRLIAQQFLDVEYFSHLDRTATARHHHGRCAGLEDGFAGRLPGFRRPVLGLRSFAVRVAA
jgi:hypothetical protein